MPKKRQGALQTRSLGIHQFDERRGNQERNRIGGERLHRPFREEEALARKASLMCHLDSALEAERQAD